VGDTQVVNTILNTPVTMKIGEVLASLWELSDQLPNMTKYKNAKQGTVNHAVVLPKDLGKLIQIPLHLSGQQVTGIIDTRSELNVINQRITRGLTEAPVNPQRKVVMNDANGGAGNLQGHISEVSLKCGSVETFANLYVGDAVPFDLLLGRPWQRDNLVSIDERIDGTYLVRVLNEVKTRSSNRDLPKKIQCDRFYVSVFPTISKYCATITKITDFTNRGT
jgi:hypothetical protein